MEAVNDSHWKTGSSTRFLVGTIGPENPKHPGTYRFNSTDGYSPPDAMLLSPDGDLDGNGSEFRPREGSPCVAVLIGGRGACFILGFWKAPTSNPDTDEAPSVGNASDNNIGGDKVWKTAGGATLALKHGGVVIVEGGEGVSIILNPQNQVMSLRSRNMTQIADGYRSIRGRKEPNKTLPQTLSTVEYYDQVGASATRVQEKTGSLPDKARRELTVASITTTKLGRTGTIKLRERYYDDGSWIAEGPKYQWGGKEAKEPFVLGLELVDVLKKMMKIISGIRVPTAWGPSGKPLPPTPIELSKLSNELNDKILSTYMFHTKKPAAPGEVKE